jgi:hypothetical protein
VTRKNHGGGKLAQRLLVRYRTSKLFKALAPTGENNDSLRGIGAEA